MAQPDRPGRGRPATGQTPKRYIRAGHLWDEAVELAESRNETMTAFVVRAIEREIKRVKREAGRDQSAPVSSTE